MIAQDVCRRKTCQRIRSIHFSRNLHNFDVFRLDGLLNPQVLGLEMFSSLQSHAGAAWTCTRKRPLRETRGSPHVLPRISRRTFTSPQHARQGHTLSCTTLLLRYLTRSLVAVCTNVERDGGQFAEVLPLCDFRVRASFAQSESVVSFTLVLSSCCHG